METVTKKQIQEAVKVIKRIDACGTGCIPQVEHEQIATEAMSHLHTVTVDYIIEQWYGWKDCGLSDDDIIRQIATARACEIVAKKHRWDINYCFEAITYEPII